MNLTMPFNGYEYGAPSWEVEEIDAEIVSKMKCPLCGGPMRYEPYWAKDSNSYISLAVCDPCKYTYAF